METLAKAMESKFPTIVVNGISALVVLLIGIILARIFSKLAQKALAEIELDKIFKQATGMKTHLEKGVATFVLYLVYFLTFITVLDQLGITGYVIYMVSGAVLIIVILSLFLGIKDFIPNMMAGFSLYREGFLKKGDHIKIKDIEGKIVHMSLIEIRVETKKGDLINIPNSHLKKNEITKRKEK